MLSLFTFMHWRRKWQPTPVFLPRESQGWGSLVAAVYGVAQSQTLLKRLSSSSSSSETQRGSVIVAHGLSCLWHVESSHGLEIEPMFPALAGRFSTSGPLLLLLLLSRFSRVRLCDPIDGSPPGSAVSGILQARTLEWGAIS